MTNQINPVVFFGSAAAILLFSIWAIIDPPNASQVIGTAVAWVGEYFGWYYFVTATIIIVFVIWIACSRYGETRLGPDHAKPDFSLFAWTAMLFAAGIGIDLMFFAVAEPVTQYLHPPQGEGQSIEAARQAIVWTMFHLRHHGLGHVCPDGHGPGLFRVPL